MQRIPRGLLASWKNNVLTITGPHLPVPQVEIQYLEAFCRPGSHDRAWSETTIPHRTRLLSQQDSGKRLVLETTLSDGVTVSHTITAGDDDIEFLLGAHNPTSRESAAHWAQPCIRVGAFTGSNDTADPRDFLRKCFVFLSGKLARMPTSPWATSARYTPGQVWCPICVVPDFRPQGRCQSAPAEPLASQQWADRMLLAGRNHDSGNCMGTIPGTLPGSISVYSFGFSYRRSASRRA